MASRLSLQADLEALEMGKVFFQPPASVRLTYPCIVYEISRAHITYSLDMPYIITNQYSLTYVTKDPDDALEAIEKIIRAFPMISHDRSYVAENLYHEVFSLFY